MQTVNKIVQKFNKLYNIKLKFILIVCLIEIFSFPILAMEEIIYFGVVNKAQLQDYNPQDKETAVLTRSHNADEEPEPIQFISEKTKFQWQGKDLEFPHQYSPFLNKIRDLELNTAGYNHLCLTLYAIYKDPENVSELRVAESPLFARTKEKAFSLNSEGLLQKITTVKFYTKIAPNHEDRWAYFTTHNGGSIAVNNDPSIFPVSSRSYECGAEGCSVICKELYPHDDDDGECQHSTNACRHTEPNALHHIKKHAIKLFAPLIEEAHGIESVKSIGVRLFSYYQPCSECVSMLHGKRNINIGEKTFKSSFIFYFNRTYLTPVMKINEDQLQLFNSYNYYFSSGFLKDNLIYASNDDQEDSIGESLGYISLNSNVNLFNKDHIFLVRCFPNYNINGQNRFKFYYY